jgi:hypothetical protein
LILFEGGGDDKKYQQDDENIDERDDDDDGRSTLSECKLHAIKCVARFTRLRSESALSCVRAYCGRNSNC